MSLLRTNHFMAQAQGLADLSTPSALQPAIEAQLIFCLQQAIACVLNEVLANNHLASQQGHSFAQVMANIAEQCSYLPEYQRVLRLMEANDSWLSQINRQHANWSALVGANLMSQPALIGSDQQLKVDLRYCISQCQQMIDEFRLSSQSW